MEASLPDNGTVETNDSLGDVENPPEVVKRKDEKIPVEDASTATDIKVAEPKVKISQKVLSSLSWFGGKVFTGMEWVGEGVVSILGLDDSRFQDVLDGMSEDEMAAAREVQRQREEEYKQMGFTVSAVGEETEQDLIRENDEAFQNLSYGMIAGSGVDRVRNTQLMDTEDIEVAVVTTEPEAISGSAEHGN